MPLRPILKALPDLPASADSTAKPPLPESAFSNPLPFSACSVRVLLSPHVHFPSHPCTLMGATHSPGTYDRAPIAVSPNVCALPERGERMYRVRDRDPFDMGAARIPVPKGSYFHPRAFEACEAPEDESQAVPLPVPSLGHLPELSSGTDDADGESSECVSPEPMSPEPPVAIVAAGRIGRPRPSVHTPLFRSNLDYSHALSFLPHPHPGSTPGHEPNTQTEKRRKRPKPRHPAARSSEFREPSVDSDSCLGGF